MSEMSFAEIVTMSDESSQLVSCMERVYKTLWGLIDQYFSSLKPANVSSFNIDYLGAVLRLMANDLERCLADFAMKTGDEMQIAGVDCFMRENRELLDHYDRMLKATMIRDQVFDMRDAAMKKALEPLLNLPLNECTLAKMEELTHTGIA